MKTHGWCERHSLRPEKQIITPRVALCRRSIILFYLYILCILNNITIECIKRKKLTSIQRCGVSIWYLVFIIKLISCMIVVVCILTFTFIYMITIVCCQNHNSSSVLSSINIALAVNVDHGHQLRSCSMSDFSFSNHRLSELKISVYMQGFRFCFCLKPLAFS